MKYPKVAVIMATYNGERYIESQVTSILEQKGVEATIYAYDDCSVDSTKHILREFVKNGYKLKLFENSKASGSAGKNFYQAILALQSKDYDYIALADQDDIWLQDKLNKSIKKLLENEGFAYSSNYLLFHPRKSATPKSNKGVKQTKYDYLFSSPGPGCTFVFTKTGFLDLQICLNKNLKEFYKCQYHDWSIYAMFRTLNLKWIIDSEAYILYRQHENNDTGANKGLKAIFKRLLLFRSNSYNDQINAVFKLCHELNAAKFKNLKRSILLHSL